MCENPFVLQDRFTVCFVFEQSTLRVEQRNLSQLRISHCKLASGLLLLVQPLRGWEVSFCFLQGEHVNDNRGFHIGDARLGGLRIFDARVKIQHDAQWRASYYQSRPITDFLMRASKFCRRVTNVKTPNVSHVCVCVCVCVCVYLWVCLLRTCRCLCTRVCVFVYTGGWCHSWCRV